MNDTLNEMFWAGYLKHALEHGHITTDDDIGAIKEQFMAGIRGEVEGT